MVGSYLWELLLCQPSSGYLLNLKKVWRTWLDLTCGNFCFVNLVQGIWQIATKLCSGSKKLRSTICSGSKKLCSTCSGNIHPVWQTLPLTGWEQREFSCRWGRKNNKNASDWLRAKRALLLWGRKNNKNGWWCRYFTCFRGKWPICWLVGGTALSRGPRMIQY